MRGLSEAIEMPSTFRPWTELMASEDYARYEARARYVWFGSMLAGALWGGWKGTLAGAFGSMAYANFVGARVYSAEADAAYKKVAWATGAIGAVEAALGLLLVRKVSSDKDDEGRSPVSLAF